jgi:intracellular sulfur oxidation DsrE/DsrF family protein
MTRTELLLVILMEECSEVCHRVSKALRFGLEDAQLTSVAGEFPQHETNEQAIARELNDLMAVVDMLTAQGLDLAVCETAIAAKRVKVENTLA